VDELIPCDFMARHAHPSSHGRLILRSLFDAPSVPIVSVPIVPMQPEGGAIGPIFADLAFAELAATGLPLADLAFADPVIPLSTTHRVHPSQGQPAPLGGPAVLPSGTRTPAVNPAAAHPGQPERSVKAPRIATPRELGSRKPGEVRPNR
jgi:hypothetical protein